MLTKQQIDELFVFCEKHFVRDYDVQVELVDHLANAVEEKMAADKNLSFDNAVKSVHAGFGVLGFSTVVNSHAQSLGKRYRKLRKELFYSYFTWPKAAMTLCVSLVLALLRNFLAADQLYIFIVTLVICLWLFELFVVHQVNRLQKKQTKKLLMTNHQPEQAFFNVSFVLQVMFLFNRSEYMNAYMASHYWFYYVIIIIITLLFVGVLAYRDLLKKIEQMAREQYPEVFAVAA